MTLHFSGRKGDCSWISWGDVALLIWESTHKMSGLYCALWESVELLLAAGKIMTSSAPGIRERPEKAGCAAFSDEQLWEERELLFFIMTSTNGKLQIDSGWHWTVFLNSKFSWIRLAWSSIWLQSSSFIHTAALVLPYPLCTKAGLFLFPTGCYPVPWASLPIRASAGTEEWSLQ